MKQALVLGAGGFIGRYVARALTQAGYGVTGIGHGSLTPQEQRQWGIAHWHVSDVTDEALARYSGQPDVLVQAAGSGSVAFSIAQPREDFARSVTTTLTALEFVRVRAPACRIVLPSSAAVYGNAASLPIRVTSRPAPVSPYGVHKLIAEDLCGSYGCHFGVRSAVVRLFSVYGIGLRKQLLWDAVHKLLAGDLSFFGTGDERRDWLHVADAAALIVAAADNASAERPVVNGGTGHSIANRSVVQCIADTTGEHRPLVFSGAQRDGDPISFEADMAEALAWGWQPRHRLHDEVPAIVDWIRSGAL